MRLLLLMIPDASLRMLSSRFRNFINNRVSKPKGANASDDISSESTL